MPYIGRAATNAGSVNYLDDISSGFDGSDTTFTCAISGTTITPGQENVYLYLDGVFQHPTDAYTISGSTITFTEAPASGVAFTGYVAGEGAYLDDGTVSTAKLDDDAVTASKLDDDGTGFQVGDLGVGGSLTSGDKLTVTGRLRASGGIIGDLTGDVTGNVSGSAATVTGAAQTNITSVGTLTGLTVQASDPSVSSYSHTILNVKENDHTALQISTPNNKIGFLLFGDSDSATSGQVAYNHATPKLYFATEGTEALSIDGSQNATFAGNVGIKNTAFESWHTNWDGVLQVGETTSLGNYGGTDTYLLENAYHDGSWKYQTTSHASKLMNQAGSYTFSVADSGSADATITWKDAFTINNNGNSIFSGDYKVGIGQGSPTNSPLEVNVTPTNATAGSSAFVHIGNGSVNTDGYISGLSLGWRENNANYRKTAIAVRARGDSAVRHDMCFLVDTANDQASATLQDSKLTIDGLTGNANFSNDIMRFHNDYTNRVYSGYTTGNAGFSVTFPIQDNSSLLVTAIFTHYGAGIGTYGCARMAWLSCRDNSQDPQDISNISSTNGGSWSISTSSSTVTVSKVAGSYSGGGHYWVKIEGSANI